MNCFLLLFLPAITFSVFRNDAKLYKVSLIQVQIVLLSLSNLFNELVDPDKTNLNHIRRIYFYDYIWKLESPRSLHEKDQPVHS